MKTTYLLFLGLITTQLFAQEITLSHNIGSNIIDQQLNVSCSGGNVNWARTFVLDDFGISDGFAINSVSFGVESTSSAPTNGVIITVYGIDDDFPTSFFSATTLGQTTIADIPTPNTFRQIYSIDFEEPVLVPNNVDVILVQVYQQNSNMTMFMGGTQESNELSWARGCFTNSEYKTTEEINRPNLNYYITVSGDKVLGTNEMNTAAFTIFPNPAATKIYINSLLPNDITGINIYDISGKLVSNQLYSNQIDISKLKKGVYFIYISSSQGENIEKFIKI